MLIVSFGLAVVHIVFTAVWLVLFARVFLIGHVESTGNWEAVKILWSNLILGNPRLMFFMLCRHLDSGGQLLSNRRLFHLLLYVDLCCIE